MIVSHLRYCITTWFYGNKTLASKIQHTTNKFIRMIYGIQHGDNINHIMKENYIMTIEQITHLEVASFMFEYTKNKLPQSFHNFFKNNILINNKKLSTRSQSNFFPSFCRINLNKQSFKYKGPLAWNQTPTTIKNSKSTKTFRAELQRYLIQK